jgi:hypothetical protein
MLIEIPPKYSAAQVVYQREERDSHSREGKKLHRTKLHRTKLLGGRVLCINGGPG